MPQLNVDPEALLAAAAILEEQAAALLAADAECDDLARSALPGWIGRSADALEELTAQWASDTAALVARMRDHAGSLRVSAASFADMDRLHSGRFTG